MRDWIGYVLEWGGVRLDDLSTTQVSILNLVVLSSLQCIQTGIQGSQS